LEPDGSSSGNGLRAGEDMICLRANGISSFVGGRLIRNLCSIFDPTTGISNPPKLYKNNYWATIDPNKNLINPATKYHNNKPINE
jgi:hypothetical protein